MFGRRKQAHKADMDSLDERQIQELEALDEMAQELLSINERIKEDRRKPELSEDSKDEEESRKKFRMFKSEVGDGHAIKRLAEKSPEEMAKLAAETAALNAKIAQAKARKAAKAAAGGGGGGGQQQQPQQVSLGFLRGLL